MPAEGKINAATIGNGTRILVARTAVGGKLIPARAKTDAVVAQVKDKKVATPPGARPRRYDIVTDLGTVESVAAIQTFWLAPADKPAKKAAAKKPAVPAAQFSAPVVPEPRSRPAEPVQMPPGFENGHKVYETTPAAPEARCVHRSRCTEAAVVRVIGKPWQYCRPHADEFEARQSAVVDGRFELVAVR